VVGAVVGAVVVVAPATVVDGVTTVLVTGDGADSRFGRVNHTNDAVTMMTASDASTATTTSRRSRGGFHPVPRLERLRCGLIASAPFR